MVIIFNSNWIKSQNRIVHNCYSLITYGCWQVLSATKRGFKNEFWSLRKFWKASSRQETSNKSLLQLKRLGRSVNWRITEPVYYIFLEKQMYFKENGIDIIEINKIYRHWKMPRKESRTDLWNYLWFGKNTNVWRCSEKKTREFHSWGHRIFWKEI